MNHHTVNAHPDHTTIAGHMSWGATKLQAARNIATCALTGSGSVWLLIELYNWRTGQ